LEQDHLEEFELLRIKGEVQQISSLLLKLWKKQRSSKWN